MESHALPTTMGMLLPGSPAIYPSKRGTLYLWEPVPRVLVSRVVGVLTAEGASAIEMAGRRAGAKYGKHSDFHDWEPMTDYEPAARSMLVQSALELFKVTEAIHIYATSNLVQLGLRAASIAVRRMTIHATRSTFETALQKALSEARRA
jgi:hypothetical protein